MNNKLTTIIGGVLAVAGIAALIIFAGPDQSDRGPVAIVDGTEISRQTYNARVDRVESQLRSQGREAELEDEAMQTRIQDEVIDLLVTEVLVLQKAEEAGFSTSEEDVEAELARTKESFESEESFNEQLASVGLTESELRTNIREGLTRQKYVESQISEGDTAVTDEEVREYYDELLSQQPEGEEAPTFEEVEVQLKSQLEDQKRSEVIDAFVASLKNEANIEILI